MLPFLTPRLESVNDKTKKTATLLIKKMWKIMQHQHVQAEKKRLTVGKLVSLANDTIIIGFWKDHATGELKTRKVHEIVGFLIPVCEKKFMDGLLSAGKTFFDTII